MTKNISVLQEAMTPPAQECVLFHDYGLAVMLMIFILMGGILLLVHSNTSVYSLFLEEKNLEVFWTFLPALILFTLAFPSLKLLYSLEAPNTLAEGHSVKVVGHQWYWSYGFSGLVGVSEEYDSFMVADDDLEPGDLRNLEVDLPVMAKFGAFNTFFVTSEDVLHSFAIPQLGVKVDAVPGRLNLQACLPAAVGSFYGQCSEICGSNHSFMPIEVEMCR